MNFTTHKFKTIVLSLAFCLGMAGPAVSQLSPGDLSKPHSELEGLTNCTQCHELGEGPSAKKCLECHTEIGQRLQQKKGYHNKVVTEEKKACFSCHSDHDGVEYELIHWSGGQAGFDHSEAGYKLEGVHEVTKCRSCHSPSFISGDLVKKHASLNLTKTFLGLNQQCLSCHHDEHRDQLTDNCESCHTFKSWKPATGFAHEKTKFQLVGVHKKADCEKCHKPAEVFDVRSPSGYTDTAHTKYSNMNIKGCYSCHSDPHKDVLGKQCESCHSQNAWRPTVNFDHNKTGFPLTGKHSKVLCEKCHKNTRKGSPEASQQANSSADPLKRFAGVKADNCSSCHKDVHSGKLGADCKSCHNSSGWQNIPDGAFDHSKTKYPLQGKHLSVTCAKCHKPGEKSDKGKSTRLVATEYENCIDCHSDEHRGQFAKRSDGGRCEVCHTVDGFMPANFTVADHEKSEFALTGAHLAQPCVFCHKRDGSDSQGKFRIFKFDSRECEACHNDPHNSQFKDSEPVKGCENCHTGSSWSQLVFDHNKNSKYALEGAHEKAECNLCHKPERMKKSQKKTFVRYRGLAHECKDCHSLETLEVLRKKQER